MDNKIITKQTDSYSIVMYGFNNKDQFNGESEFYDINPNAVILFSGSKEELLDREEERAFKGVLEMVPDNVGVFKYKIYADNGTGCFCTRHPRESLESALSTLKENKYILIVKEKNNG